MTTPDSHDEVLLAEAIAAADALLRAAERATTRGERRRATRLGRLLDDDTGRALMFALTDEVLRTDDPVRSMRRLRAILECTLPRSLATFDRAGLRLASMASRVAPSLVSRAVHQRLRHETTGVILPATDPDFAAHAADRRAAGFRANVNLLGEAILGDDEADARLAAVQAWLRRPDVDYVSVKISALCANLDVLAYESSLDRISDRLRRVYRTAMESTPPAFVNLDMEEYRDLHLTVEAFMRVLSDKEFRSMPAGIALQAYLPDSFAALDDVSMWAQRRHREGGAWIKVRLVKGANLGMERVEAEVAGWPQAPFSTKADVDASFKLLLDRALDAAEGGNLRVGVGSHNLFDVAWALALRRDRHLDDVVDIEMLEGMAPAQARASRDAACGLVLYTPVVAPTDFAAAISYLARRLDENAAADNFLRALFSLTPGSSGWHRERRRFENAVRARHAVDTSPRRTQNRGTEHRVFDPDATFANEPDTDFSLAANRGWIIACLAREQPAPSPALLATVGDIDAVVARARSAHGTWSTTTTAQRRAILNTAAEVMAANRGRTLSVMAHETGKTVREGDTEVSEAIDFARWSATGTRTFDALAADGVTAQPIGTVVVAAPWNFPYAIPANGVLTALAGGNTVILKPAPEAVACAVELTRHLHEAGVPPDVLQLVRCPDDDVGRHLVTHDGVHTVVLTGAYATAQMFLTWKPSMRLVAETSGKNAIVITGAADVDLAIRDLVRSAFGHAGQKCSAASLAILDADLYDDPRFAERLADVVRSVRVGPATDLATVMGPLVGAPTDPLHRALTRLDPGERWLVEPRPLDGDALLWTPGVRVGVQPGSWFHRTECFGPVLGVMRADGLDHAIELQNATDYGLTGGLHSLDPAEVERWLERVEVGNAYVNRAITGAIVQRQPFGGWKRSSVGPGAKTGGHHDLMRFVSLRPEGEVPDLEQSAASYERWWRDLYSVALDSAGLRSEHNTLRFRPFDRVVVRAAPETSDHEIELVKAAAAVVGAGCTISPVSETEEHLSARLTTLRTQRLRALGPIGDLLATICHGAGITIDTAPVTGHGRAELRHWLSEQAISQTAHRHGRLSG